MSHQTEQYKAEAAQRWGSTEAYAEYLQKPARDPAEQQAGIEAIFAAFAAAMMQGETPDSPPAQALVKDLQEYITAQFYTCTDSILAGLGQMYTADERFRRNIDKHGVRTAAYVSSAIDCFCRQTNR